MTTVFDGFAASEGIARGKAHLLAWDSPEIPHDVVPVGGEEVEVERFRRAIEHTRARLMELRRETEERLGEVEARIFEPQLLMLEDVEVAEGTERYIRENRLSAAWAFDWRMRELEAMWRRTHHPMVLDKLNDLEDLRVRMLHALLDLPDPWRFRESEEPVIIVAHDLTPSLTVQMDPERVRGIATDEGTRTSHWVILARSLSIPAVVGLRDISSRVSTGQEILLDGRAGRVMVAPDATSRRWFDSRATQLRSWESSAERERDGESHTADGRTIVLRANLDLPSEAEKARGHGAEGIGLFRTEFLVVGRSAIPTEEEQLAAYGRAVKAFAGLPVYIRTFDLGGDKFPMFLSMPAEENPFLGWRSIRVCLDEPDLFRTQLRAILRAGIEADVRIVLPLVNETTEIRRAREILREEADSLVAAGVPVNPDTPVGALIETPAAALNARALAAESDFLSIGTNDLVQYTLAVDRTNARLSALYDPFHPGVLRQIQEVVRVGQETGREVTVCGELASHPLGLFLLVGLGVTVFSIGWQTLPELRQVVRALRASDAEVAAAAALAAPTGRDAGAVIREAVVGSLDPAHLAGRWGLVPSDPAG